MAQRTIKLTATHLTDQAVAELNRGAAPVETGQYRHQRLPVGYSVIGEEEQ